jgi:hypothetical protein
MAKMRSPNYPAIGLEDAIKAVGMIWNEEKRTAVPLDVLSKALGYKGVSGPVRTKVAALRKYGLLEQNGVNYRVSDLAMQIIHGQDHSEERSNALVEAATRPEIFKELRETHLEGSDEALKSYLLVRKGFSEAGAKQLIKAFRETMDVAEAASGGNIPRREKEESEAKSMTTTYTKQQEESSKHIRVNVGTPGGAAHEATPTIQSYSFALSMPRNVRAELRLFGQVTKGDVERLRKQIEFLEEQFEDEAN